MGITGAASTFASGPVQTVGTAESENVDAASENATISHGYCAKLKQRHGIYIKQDRYRDAAGYYLAHKKISVRTIKNFNKKCGKRISGARGVSTINFRHGAWLYDYDHTHNKHRKFRFVL